MMHFSRKDQRSDTDSYTHYIPIFQPQDSSISTKISRKSSFQSNMKPKSYYFLRFVHHPKFLQILENSWISLMNQTNDQKLGFRPILDLISLKTRTVTLHTKVLFKLAVCLPDERSFQKPRFSHKWYLFNQVSKLFQNSYAFALLWYLWYVYL